MGELDKVIQRGLLAEQEASNIDDETYSILKIICSWCNRFQSGNRFSPNTSHTICPSCYHDEMRRLREMGSPFQKAIERRFN